MLNASGINPKTYIAVEYDPTIASNISRSLISGGACLSSIKDTRILNCDVLDLSNTSSSEVLQARSINFFNLDFCGSLGSSWKAFLLPSLLYKMGAQKIALTITFSPRSPSKPVLKVDHSLRVLAPRFYDLDLLYLEQHNYRDTSAMCSWLAFYERKK